jgi:hypothetical protein
MRLQRPVADGPHPFPIICENFAKRAARSIRAQVVVLGLCFYHALLLDVPESTFLEFE